MKLTIHTLGQSLFSIFLFIGIFTTSCKKDTIQSEIFVDRRWNIPLSSTNIANSAIPELQSAQSLFTLMSDQKLYYDVYFDRIKEGRTPKTIKISKNNIDFIEINTNSWDEKSLKGSEKITPEQIKTLTSVDATITVTINSDDYPNGLVAGKLLIK